MTREEKQRIVNALNARYRTTLPVDVIEVAVQTGFTTWEILRQEASAHE